MAFTMEALNIDCRAETERLVSFIRRVLSEDLHKRGAVVGISSGIDSSVTAALCVRALGPQRVIGLIMPERDSHPETLQFSRKAADFLGIRSIHRDITPILEGLGFYRDLAEVVRGQIPGYGDGWKWRISASDPVEHADFAFFSLVVRSPDGEVIKKRMPVEVFLKIVALSNFKQRTRMMLEYHYADRFHYAVAGTSNRLETDQGFFVKLGDGAGDFKPIAHLYKSQIYKMAEYLGFPEDIRSRPPSSDIHSFSQGQDEFFFGLPYREMDACLYGEENGIPAGDVAAAIGLEPEMVARLYRSIAIRRARTAYLKAQPLRP